MGCHWSPGSGSAWSTGWCGRGLSSFGGSPKTRLMRHRIRNMPREPYQSLRWLERSGKPILSIFEHLLFCSSCIFFCTRLSRTWHEDNLTTESFGIPLSFVLGPFPPSLHVPSVVSVNQRDTDGQKDCPRQPSPVGPLSPSGKACLALKFAQTWSPLNLPECQGRPGIQEGQGRAGCPECPPCPLDGALAARVSAARPSPPLPRLPRWRAPALLISTASPTRR